MIKQQTIDLNIYLPKFYTKQQQISLKLNPLLKKVRQNNIVSYHQFQNINLNPNISTQLQKIKIQTKYSVFHRQQPKQRGSSPSITLSKQDNNLSQNNNKNDNKFKILQKYRNIHFKYSTPENNNLLFSKQSHVKNHSYSYNVRSKTSQKIKNKNYSTLIPKTADHFIAPKTANNQNNKFNIELDKINKLDFNINPQNGLQNIDEEFFNLIRLKMLTKTPYFNGGKFAKFKKHLVQQINFKQIQKKFYKSPSSMTKYDKFFEQILIKKQKSLLQAKKNFIKNQTQNRTIDVVNQVKKDDKKFDFTKSTYSHQLQPRKNIYNQISFNDKTRKTSFKARLWSKKQSLNTSKQWNQLYSPSKYESELTKIQITGSKKNLSPDKNKAISSFS